MNGHQSQTDEALALDGPAAARLTGLSAKTLERRFLEGAPVGRIKIGRRVLFLRTALESWLKSLAGSEGAKRDGAEK